MNTYKKKIKWNIVKALNTLDKNKKKMIIAKLNAKRLES